MSSAAAAPKNRANEKFSLDKYPLGVYSEDTPRGYLKHTSGGTAWKNGTVPCAHSAKRSARRRNTRSSSTASAASRARSAAFAAWSKTGHTVPILVQSAAANAALNAFNKELLASHLRSCVANDIREGHDEVIDELVVTLQKLMK